MKAATIFTRALGGQQHAFTMRAEAMHPSDSDAAARACAARHFGVPPSWITLERDSANVVIAYWEQPTDPRKRALWIFGLGALFCTALALALYLAPMRIRVVDIMVVTVVIPGILLSFAMLAGGAILDYAQACKAARDAERAQEGRR